MFRLNPSSPNKMSFLDGGKRGNAGNNGEGNNGPEHRRHGKEEQKTCHLVGRCVREAEAFADSQRRYLIDDLDGNNNPSPYP